MSPPVPPPTRPRRVLLVHRYFWPDTPPYASILCAIGRRLADAGHEVTVLTCQPSYRPQTHARGTDDPDEGLRVVRWRVLGDRRSGVLKLVNMLLFAARVVGARRHWRDADVIVAATTPPVLVAWCCSILASASGARFIYHRQDIYPEVMGRPGSGRARLLRGVLRTIDAGIDRRAWRSVVLSEDMAETVQRRSQGRARVEVLNNFDPWSTAPSADRPPDAGAELVIVFAGNLGRFQALDQVLELIGRTADQPRVRWHVFGDGPMLPRFQEAEREQGTVRTHGFQPPEVVAEFVRTRAHLGVVSVNPGVIRAAYPSKTLTYLRQGCPVLALVEGDSELARMIDRERIGVSRPHERLSELAGVLRRLADTPEALVRMRADAAAAYRRHFEADLLLDRWQGLVEAP